MADVIGRNELHRAIRESFEEHAGDSRRSLEALGFDNRAVDAYAERCLAHYSMNEVAPEVACKAAFVLGLELGFRIGHRRGTAGR